MSSTDGRLAVLREAIAEVYQPQLRGRAAVDQAAAAFGRPLAENPGDMPFTLVIAPGVIQLSGYDLELAYWRDPRAIQRGPGGRPRRMAKREGIAEWTRKSRSRMMLTLASLDWSHLADAAVIPVMSTLTYPGDWVTVAPDGVAVRKHLNMLRLRWQRVWGEPLRAAWKLEFQRRGAPHLHIGPMLPPLGRAGEQRRVAFELAVVTWEASGRQGRKPYFREAVGDGLRFREWLSFTWADIVNHPDPDQRQAHLLAGISVTPPQDGLRLSDPKRLSIYFSKHAAWGSKEYQNKPPVEWAGKRVGRFWGYWGLAPARAVIPLTRGELLAVSRVLRKLSERSHVWNPQVRQVEVVKSTRDRRVQRQGRKRTVCRPVRRLRRHRGFICVNDGPGLAVTVLVRLMREGGGP